MDHILRALINPIAVLMLFVVLYAFSVHVWAYYKPATNANGVVVTTGRFWGILWIVLGILALIAWGFLVFS